MKGEIIAGVIAAVLAISGVAFLAFAAYLGLLEVVRPVFAALLSGAGLLLLAVALVYGARVRRRRRAARGRQAAALDAVERELGEHVGTLVSAGARRQPTGVALGTLLLGVIAGRFASGRRQSDGARRRRHGRADGRDEAGRGR